MNAYNDADKLMCRVGANLIHSMHDEYEKLVEEDEDTYVSEAMEGWVYHDFLIASVLRATGLLDEAYESVIEQVEMAVIEDRTTR